MSRQQWKSKGYLLPFGDDEEGSPEEGAAYEEHIKSLGIEFEDNPNPASPATGELSVAPEKRAKEAVQKALSLVGKSRTRGAKDKKPRKKRGSFKPRDPEDMSDYERSLAGWEKNDKGHGWLLKKPYEDKPEPYVFFNDAIAKTLPPLYSQEKLGKDAVAHVKFFDPQGGWTWYATEYDPKQRLFFGLVDGFERELGYFSLDELKSVRGRLGLPIERDIHWTPTKLSNI